MGQVGVEAHLLKITAFAPPAFAIRGSCSSHQSQMDLQMATQSEVPPKLLWYKSRQIYKGVRAE
eukprot:5990135-Amphidinium_carterae.1